MQPTQAKSLLLGASSISESSLDTARSDAAASICRQCVTYLLT